MKQEFIRYGYQIDSFAFNTEGKNLFAIKTGYKYPNKKFMLGAHYDNWPLLAVASGADDNASGSSTVLEAGRVFSNYNFPYTIVFALWDEEEPGLLGSTAYVPTISSNNDTLLGYINVDMLGWDGNNDSVADINVRPIGNSIALSNKAQLCNTLYNIQLGLHIVNPGNGSTDHAPFWNNGFSAIGIDEEYDNDFNPYWHTPADSLARFNLSFYQKCSKLAYATLADLAMDTLNTVGVFENTIIDNIVLYPNPTQGKVYIKNNNENTEPIFITMFDVFGNLIYSVKITKSENDYLIDTDKLNIKSGMYFVKINRANNTSKIKLIKN
ncbi:MAG: M28 family peptidase [Bacteroidia bacterium]|nr:M28 family peptidase [Bacteroidia bacterium]